jgi:hypothetical protein
LPAANRWHPKNNWRLRLREIQSPERKIIDQAAGRDSELFEAVPEFASFL